jgi:geranylgeranyl pyrophosphate synthase
MIDLTEGKGRGGEVGCDIREGKPSIFFAHALEALPAGDPRRAALVAAIVKPREETRPDDVQRVMDLYREVGAFGFADAECARLVEAAYQVIERLPLAEDGKELFRAIGRFMIDRRS